MTVWFCTVQNIADFLQLTIDAAHIEAAEQAITAASAAIQNYCHQYLAEVKDDVVTFDIAHLRYDLHLLELAGREKAGTTRPPEDKMLPRVQNKALPKTANKGGEA